MNKCRQCGLEKPNSRFICPQRICPLMLNGKRVPRRTSEYVDPENIYDSPSIRQSVEEDRAKRGR